MSPAGRTAGGALAEAPDPPPPSTHWSIDLLLALALLVIIGTIAFPALDAVRQRDRMHAVCAEARNLYDGFGRYYEKNHAYPSAEATRPFQSDILQALKSTGYYNGEIRDYLVNGRVDAYDTPHDEGQGHEFWVEMTLDADSKTRLLIAHSDDAPLGRGRWMDGAFLLQDGKVEPL